MGGDALRQGRAALTPPRAALVLASQSYDHQVAGLPVLLRALLALQDSGITHAAVVGHPEVTDSRLRMNLSFPAARELTLQDGQPLMVVDGRRVFHRHGPTLMMSLDALDPQEAVAAKTSDGKGAGLWVAGPEAAARLAELIRQGDAKAPGDAHLWAAKARDTVFEPGLFSVEVKDQASADRAEVALMRSLRKPIDGIMAKLVNRSISLPLSRRLARTSVTPNQATVVAWLFALAAAVMTAWGANWGMGYWLAGVGGALLLEVQSILDGVDGELSRLKFLRSRLGEWMDTLGDDSSDLMYQAALTLHLGAKLGVSWPYYVGGLAVGAAFCERLILYTLLSRVYGSGDLLAIDFLHSAPQAPARGLARVGQILPKLLKRDFYVTLFLALALVNLTQITLVVVAVAHVIFLIVLLSRLPGALRRGRQGGDALYRT